MTSARTVRVEWREGLVEEYAWLAERTRGTVSCIELELQLPWIDAIRTLGMSPMEFLVLPRLLALVLVMPLLTLYSGVLGMCGGALVAIGMDVSWTQYVHETRLAVTLTHILTGVAKSVVFGLLIAIAGCRAGMQCGRSSEAVGKATTRAVVTAIVWLIVADAAFNIVYQRLGI